MKRLIFLLVFMIGGLMAVAQSPISRPILRGTQYLQSDTLKSITTDGISIDSNRLRDMANPVDSTDAVNLRTMQDSIAAMVAGNPDTDDQTLSIDSVARRFTISITGGNSVNFEDQNTDNQTAAQVPYTNTTSGLLATDVQAAVDELDAAIEAAASGGVVSVNSKTGIVVLGTDDIAEGVTNQYYTEAKVAANSAVTLNTAKETNATHTGEVTGSGALTISNDVVDYARVDPTLKGAITDNDGAWDWSAAGLINAAISTNTTVTFSNLNLNKQLKIRLTLSAGAVITWPTYVTVAGATLGDGTFKIYADCWNAGSTTEDVFINIIAE